MTQAISLLRRKLPIQGININEGKLRIHEENQFLTFPACSLSDLSPTLSECLKLLSLVSFLSPSLSCRYDVQVGEASPPLNEIKV